MLVGLLFFTGYVQSQEFDVSMVAYVDCDSSAYSDGLSAKPHICGMSPQVITLMIRGQNIATIDEDSLKFSKIEIGGKDLLNNSKGKNAFKLGSFPRVGVNGEYAMFNLEFKSAPFGHIGSASLAGTIDILTGKKMIDEERSSIDLTNKFTLDVGLLTLSNQPKPKPKLSVKGALGAFLEKELNKLENEIMKDEKDDFIIYVSGNLDSLISLDVYENGRKLDHGWNSTRREEMKMHFEKPAGSKIDIKLKYWDGIQRVTVPINL
jgi:hypothetical protein